MLRLEEKRSLCGYKCSEVLLLNNFNKVYTFSPKNESFVGQKCKVLLGAGSEEVLIFFVLSEAFPSNTLLVTETCWGIGHIFPPSNTGAGYAVCRQSSSPYDSAS